MYRANLLLIFGLMSFNCSADQEFGFGYYKDNIYSFAQVGFKFLNRMIVCSKGNANNCKDDENLFVGLKDKPLERAYEGMIENFEQLDSQLLVDNTSSLYELHKQFTVQTYESQVGLLSDIALIEKHCGRSYGYREAASILEAVLINIWGKDPTYSEVEEYIGKRKVPKEQFDCEKYYGLNRSLFGVLNENLLYRNRGDSILNVSYYYLISLGYIPKYQYWKK